MEEKKDLIEQVLGGIFGVIAVRAAVCEMFINGINATSIADCIKDAFGTMAIIVLLFAIIKVAFSMPSETEEKIITVTLKHSIKSKNDICKLIDFINPMYTAYLVSARIAVEKK